MKTFILVLLSSVVLSAATSVGTQDVSIDRLSSLKEIMYRFRIYSFRHQRTNLVHRDAYGKEFIMCQVSQTVDDTSSASMVLSLTLNVHMVRNLIMLLFCVSPLMKADAFLRAQFDREKFEQNMKECNEMILVKIK